MYKVSDFDYHLPSELIAQKPIRPRDHSRLLLLNKKTGALEHKYFYNLIDQLQPGDLLVLNNSKVFPARLIGKKTGTGGKIEIFLHKKNRGAHEKNNVWECLVGGRVKSGLLIDFPKKLQAEILHDNADGTWQVKFNLNGPKFWEVINKIGLVPLPPYIKRDRKNANDKMNYQTVFAAKNKVGSVAAPTAGLHFTKNLLKKLRSQGVKIEYVTLHVGLGTFAPVKTENISDHKMHSEFATVSAKTIKEILKVKQRARRVIAVGTTSARTLESLNWEKIITTSAQMKRFAAQSFWTDIFIYPSYQFKIIDALVTNFHLPKSTLLMLVSALAGKRNIDRAYLESVRRQYRFFSYGDAMFIY